MRMNHFRLVIVFLILLQSSFVFAQMTRQQSLSKFVLASEAYKQGDYKKSANVYEEILTEGLESGALYYNLGNAYFKQDKLGKAIVNYERAQRLIPRDSDLKFNIEYAKTLVTKTVDINKPNFIENAITQHVLFYSFDEMILMITALLFLLGLMFLLSRVFKWSKSIRYFTRVFFSILIIVFIGGAFLKVQLQDSRAIIVNDATVNYEPRDESTVHYQLKVGAKVKIIQKKGLWMKIKRDDGRLGWILKDKLEEI